MGSTPSSERYQYLRLANDLEKKIKDGTFVLDQKLPSLRTLRSQTGLAMGTVLKAYLELESRGLIRAMPRSGYFVLPNPSIIPAKLRKKKHQPIPKKVTLDRLIYSLTEEMSDESFTRLGGIAMSPEFLPCKSLYQELKSLPPSKINEVIAAYVAPSGNTELRRQTLKRMLHCPQTFSVDDVIVTSGCTEAMELCLRAVAKPDGAIIIESPTDPWLRLMLKHLDLMVVEVPSDSKTGIDLSCVEDVIRRNKVSACVINPQFQNPLGYLMPDQRKKELIELLSHQEIPIIENDVYGELFFGRKKPLPIKAFDTDGSVLYCSSFSKTMAAGLRVGWSLPGRYHQAVKEIKFNRSFTSPAINQYMVQSYLKKGTFDRHLRQLRMHLKKQLQIYSSSVKSCFPEGTKITSPQGGLFLWIELPHSVQGLDVYRLAREQKISILPGLVCSDCSQSEKHLNCIRINCGSPWESITEAAIHSLASIIFKLL